MSRTEAREDMGEGSSLGDLYLSNISPSIVNTASTLPECSFNVYSRTASPIFLIFP